MALGGGLLEVGVVVGGEEVQVAAAEVLDAVAQVALQPALGAVGEHRLLEGLHLAHHPGYAPGDPGGRGGGRGGGDIIAFMSVFVYDYM